jgi:hypothetical protein
MTFDGLENRMAEDIMHEIDNPTLIAAEVSKLLNEPVQEDMMVVRRLAKDFAAAIKYELALKDGDMVDVVRRQRAVLHPMTAWLESHGVDCRSFATRAAGMSVCCEAAYSHSWPCLQQSMSPSARTTGAGRRCRIGA